jgi:hypothetical protein
MKSQKNVFDDEIPHKNGGFDVCETLKYETPPRKDGKKNDEATYHWDHPPCILDVFWRCI